MIVPFEIIIDTKTVSESNKCEHYILKYKRKKEQKKKVNLAFNGPTRQALQKIYDSGFFNLQIKLTRISPRKLDTGDNLPISMKAIRDYIADIIIPGKQPGRADDSNKIIWIYDQCKGQPKQYGVKVHILPVSIS